jgi:hypothetical protein
MQVEEQNKDIYSLLARMKTKLETMRQEAKEEQARCFALLHDALVYSAHKMHLLSAGSLVEFIELTAWTVREKEPGKDHYRAMEQKLKFLGFSIEPAN